MFNHYQKCYYKLLLEEVIQNVDKKPIPEPFKSLLDGMKQAMHKAINAPQNQLKNINEKVNEWKMKLINAWGELKNTLTDYEQQLINDTLQELIVQYRHYMHGCNTGY